MHRRFSVSDVYFFSTSTSCISRTRAVFVFFSLWRFPVSDFFFPTMPTWCQCHTHGIPIFFLSSCLRFVSSFLSCFRFLSVYFSTGTSCMPATNSCDNFLCVPLTLSQEIKFVSPVHFLSIRNKTYIKQNRDTVS
jgi:hypothetical protein